MRLALGICLIACMPLIWGSHHFGLSHLFSVSIAVASIFGVSLFLLKWENALNPVLLAFGCAWSLLFPELSHTFGWQSGFHLQMLLLTILTLLFDHIPVPVRIVMASIPLLGLLFGFPNNAGIPPAMPLGEDALILIQTFNAFFFTVIVMSVVLYQRLGILTAKRAAVELSLYRGELISNLSHELKTPLAAMLTAVQASGRHERDAESYLRTLALCERNARGMGLLVHRMLDLSASQSGRMAPRMRSVDLAELIQAAVELHGESAEVAGVELIFAPSEVAVIESDPDLLAIALNNLLGNAIGHAPAGSAVTLNLERTGDGEIQINVVDHGSGISAEEIPLIFQPFYRVDKSRTRTADAGHGLGLSIAQSMMETLGGRIEVSSEPNHGSVFSLVLSRAMNHSS